MHKKKKKISFLSPKITKKITYIQVNPITLSWVLKDFWLLWLDKKVGVNMVENEKDLFIFLKLFFGMVRYKAKFMQKGKEKSLFIL